MRVYHGTLKAHVPALIREGITPSEGWGWTGQSGVSLATKVREAGYWARMAWLHQHDLPAEERRLGAVPRDELAIIAVDLPEHALAELQADHDQLEDFNLDPDASWIESADVMSSIVYPDHVPASWIVGERHVPRKV